ncbi:MAG TPA: outer membrane lipoprotein carrier protein LolA [Terriglobales bacterium]|jgi:outer membrane lipoprotein-sorting protein|nr:outer membrane lipoprotein carrier protein LolA [Terriglobales bacterium]
MKRHNHSWELRRTWILALMVVLAVPAFSKRKHSQDAAPQQPESGQANLKSGSLDQVLRRMDESAAKFRNAQADFVWTPYNSVINETEAPDKGKIYFRKVDNETQMAATIQPPDDRQIVFTGGKVQVYQPKTKLLDVYDASAHKAEVESFLVLGFGSSGEDLRKSFEVKYVGDEKIGSVQTEHLQLTPLAEKVKKSFPRIDLWIDPQGLSLRQQLFQTGGDYRLADYSNIRLNEKIPDSAFKIKTSGPTKTVTH